MLRLVQSNVHPGERSQRVFAPFCAVDQPVHLVRALVGKQQAEQVGVILQSALLIEQTGRHRIVDRVAVPELTQDRETRARPVSQHAAAACRCVAGL